jgi:hypothetical protein
MAWRKTVAPDMWYIFTHCDAQAEPPSESARVAQDSSSAMARASIASEPPLKRRRHNAQQETRNAAPETTGPKFRHARDKKFYERLPGSSEEIVPQTLDKSRKSGRTTNAPPSESTSMPSSGPTHATRLVSERRSALLAGLHRVYFDESEDVLTEELRQALMDMQRLVERQTSPQLIVIEDGESDDSPPLDTTNLAGKSPVQGEGFSVTEEIICPYGHAKNGPSPAYYPSLRDPNLTMHGKAPHVRQLA